MTPTAGQISRRLPQPLSPDEEKALEGSARVVRQALDDLEAEE